MVFEKTEINKSERFPLVYDPFEARLAGKLFMEWILPSCGVTAKIL